MIGHKSVVLFVALALVANSGDQGCQQNEGGGGSSGGQKGGLGEAQAKLSCSRESVEARVRGI